MNKGLLLITSALLAGCVATPKLVTSVDPYTKVETYRYEPLVALDCEKDTTFMSGIVLAFHGGAERDMVSVTWRANDWVFLNPGYGLSMVIDGDVRKLQGVGSPSRQVFSDGSIREDVTFLVDQETVKRMRSASLVRFKVTGSNGFIERCLKSEELAYLDQVIPLIKTR